MDVKVGCIQTDAGVLVPDDWYFLSFGSFVALQRGHDLTWRERRSGEVPVMGSAGVNGFHDVALAKGPGVVLGRSGASFGQAHYCHRDYWPHNTALYVTDFLGNDPLFVYYFLAAFDFTRHNSGGAQQSLNRNFIAPIAIAIPPPPEQRAIATALSNVDALLTGLERLIAKKRDLKITLLQQLVSGEIRLPGFSGRWELKPFAGLASIRNEKIMPAQVEPDSTCVELDHIGQGDGRLVTHSTARHSTSLKYRFFAGDVLFGRLRSYLRKYWLADRAGICTTEIWPLIADPEQAVSGFLFALVQSDRFIKAASVSYGTHMPRADWTVVRDLPVHCPDIEEQAAIAAVLSDMDAEVVALEARRDKTRGLKQAMMKELLTGRIRLVPSGGTGA